jgi:hypothetical protein
MNRYKATGLLIVQCRILFPRCADDFNMYSYTRERHRVKIQRSKAVAMAGGQPPRGCIGLHVFRLGFYYIACPRQGMVGDAFNRRIFSVIF